MAFDEEEEDIVCLCLFVTLVGDDDEWGGNTSKLLQ